MSGTTYHDATILSCVSKKDDDGTKRLHFEVKLDNGGVENASHPWTGKHGEIGKRILEEQGLTWPEALQQLDKLTDNGCRVKIAFKPNPKGGEWRNVYIVTGGAGSGGTIMSKDELAEEVRKLKLEGKDDEPPF